MADVALQNFSQVALIVALVLNDIFLVKAKGIAFTAAYEDSKCDMRMLPFIDQ